MSDEKVKVNEEAAQSEETVEAKGTSVDTNEKEVMAPTEEVKTEKPKKKRTTKKAEKEPEDKAEEAPAETSDEDNAEMPSSDDTEKEEADKSAKEMPAEETKPKRRSNILREKKRAIEKGLSEEAYIEAAISRETFSGAIASKKDREEILNEDRVITEEGDEEARTLATIYKEEYQDLRGSALAGNVLEGEIIGAHKVDPDNPTSMVLADVRYKTGAFKVCIPSFLLFDYDEAVYMGEKGNNDLIESVKKRITATIKFVASYVDEKEGICYADRLRALSLIGSKHYLNNWKDTDEPHIYAGLRGKGRIMAVGRQYVIVEVLGADIRIPQDELSYMHIGDARRKFSVDEEVNVFITEVTEKNVIKRRNKYRLVNAKGSIKRAYPNEKKKYFNEFPLHMYTSAEITYIDEELHVYCLLNGGKMDCVCPYPKGGPKPIVGQKRVVEITGRDEDQLRLFGTFRRN